MATATAAVMEVPTARATTIAKNPGLHAPRLKHFVLSECGADSSLEIFGGACPFRSNFLDVMPRNCLSTIARLCSHR